MALPKRRPENGAALRLIDTHKIERADWLEVRKTGIGGSDAAPAVGLSPYKSPLELCSKMPSVKHGTSVT